MHHPQLYLLTNDDQFALLYAKLELAFATGAVSLLQLRRKKLLNRTDGQACLYDEAIQIKALTQQYGVRLIINDDSQLAKQLDVGVHLGKDDGSVTAARALLGNSSIIGQSCYNQVQLVQDAKRNQASYAAMGAVFPSRTKPDAKLVNRKQIVLACQQGIDMCVIGGLNIDNVRQLSGLPITYVAVLSDIINQPLESIAARCQQWRQVLLNW